MLEYLLGLIITRMGVTLERVQNKFACIIGELCSEPVLLSQFAIWVDLRISEYKSKGTISLDCSGENPDPSWLKGHINPSPRRGIEAGELIRPRPGPASARNSLPHKSILGSRDPSRLSNIQSQRLQESARNEQNVDFDQDRLSPDVVVVKEEPTDSDAHGAGVFPVTLHKHSNSSPSGRKRTADSSDHDLLQSDSSFFSQNQSFQSPSKMRRIDSTSDDGATLDSQSNQSFMSIIGLPEQDYQEGGELSQSDMSLMVSGDEHKGGNSFSFRQTSAAATATLSSPSTSDAASRLNAGGNAVPESKRDAQLPHGGRRPSIPLAANDGSSPGLSRLKIPQTRSNASLFGGTGRHSNKEIRSRVLHVHDKAESTIRGIVNVVAILERFLTSRYGDCRRVEAIPPVELDAYLVDFFYMLKKPDGREYDPYSLSNLRSYLDRFLREHNYPCSIGLSATFSGSQHAFTTKRRSLMMARNVIKDMVSLEGQLGLLSAEATRAIMKQDQDLSPQLDAACSSARKDLVSQITKDFPGQGTQDTDSEQENRDFPMPANKDTTSQTTRDITSQLINMYSRDSVSRGNDEILSESSEALSHRSVKESGSYIDPSTDVGRHYGMDLSLQTYKDMASEATEH